MLGLFVKSDLFTVTVLLGLFVKSDLFTITVLLGLLVKSCLFTVTVLLDLKLELFEELELKDEDFELELLKEEDFEELPELKDEDLLSILFINRTVNKIKIIIFFIIFIPFLIINYIIIS